MPRDAIVLLEELSLERVGISMLGASTDWDFPACSSLRAKELVSADGQLPAPYCDTAEKLRFILLMRPF